MLLRFLLSLCLALSAAGWFESRLQAQEQAQERVQQYLVKLRDVPVILYLHSQSKASKLRRALRYDLRAPAATQYRSRLRAKQASLKRLIENLPDATVQAQMDTVFNGMAVTLRPQDVPAVMQFAEVEEVIPSIRYYKALDTALPLAGVPQAWMNPA